MSIFNQDKNPFVIKLLAMKDVVSKSTLLHEELNFIFKTHDSDNYFILFRSIVPVSELRIPKWIRNSSVSITILLYVQDAAGIVKVMKHKTFAKSHIDNNHIIFSSRHEYQTKVARLIKSLYPEEIEEINQHPIEALDNNDPYAKISMKSIIRWTYGQLKSEYDVLSGLIFPGGRVYYRDTKLIDTCQRELEEELGIRCNINDEFFLYHNIYDMFNEKYYNNIMLIGTVPSLKNVVLSCEIKDIDIIPLEILPDEFQQIYEKTTSADEVAASADKVATPADTVLSYETPPET